MLHTVILKLNDSLNSDVWSKWFHLLELEKQNKIKTLRFADNRLRCLAAGILLRSMLFNHCQVLPSELVFSTNEKGKPFLVSHPELFFNLSHSGDYVCCSLSSSPVGVDIEKMETLDIESIASYFSIHEKKYICSKDTEQEHLDAFYSLWTLKEAFSKYIGSGLSIPLDTYSFFLNKKKFLFPPN
ncbi:4'-phosphopantetheinyl transferase [Enterococcus sp. DIV0840]|uniref:4'-phosphopantetheinyl transferase family protein n=1 Tax=unclassified Enterococcus TaxID=2608891 RepID=UPI001A8FE233|nr:4'-phosphopantetheinyl transferase superfamily protein [Enterococcus sp. DIV0849a]MBO0434411.1 4'-phosphopantetheinyl transferase superfamily protein [Enterococcus sp. DIV0849a]